MARTGFLSPGTFHFRGEPYTIKSQIPLSHEPKGPTNLMALFLSVGCYLAGRAEGRTVVHFGFGTRTNLQLVARMG